MVDALEISDFTQEGASCDNRETWPQSPDKTTENGNNFVAEELPKEHHYSITSAEARPGTLTGGNEITNRIAIGMSHPAGNLH